MHKHQCSFIMEDTNTGFSFWKDLQRLSKLVDISYNTHLDDGASDECILKRVETCGKNLAWWNRNIFGNVRKELEKKKAQLAQAEMEAIVSAVNHKVRELKENINVLLDREARLWCQWSRVLWLQNGDNNTKFFHCRVSKRHRRNLIRGIKDETNTWQVLSEQIAPVFVRYY